MAPRAKAAARVDLGPYPLEINAPLSQDIDVSWYDPAKTLQRVEQAKAKPKALKRAALQEADGDPAKAVAVLLTKCKEPDAAQALFEVMAQLATLKPGDTLSLPAVKEGKATATAEAPAAKDLGIHAVAKVAEVLGARQGTKEMGHFDGPLLERAILLMAFNGAPDLPGVKKVPLANGKGEVPPIDPVVRATLRALLKAGELPQIMAARALGQLGDIGTAQEIIAKPGLYPGASIADFGPGAVEAFKQKRLKDLSRGVEGFDTFVQGMRLTPRYQETAIDLAIAGDAGAAMAMERNFAQQFDHAGLKEDELMASYLDQMLRFKGTRTAFRAGGACALMDRVVDFSPTFRKTHEMMLRIMDYNLTIVFEKKDWVREDLVQPGFCNFGLLTALWHEAKYKCHWGQLRIHENWQDYFYAFYQDLEKLVRKHYKPNIEANADHYPGEVASLNRYLRHLGLPCVKDEHRPLSMYHLAVSHPEDEGKDPLEEDKKGLWGTPENWVCIRLGHLKEGERF